MRREVTKRADNRCEYCDYPQSASFISFQMEHIIAEKHGGDTTLANLALACATCNLAKGSDIGSLDPETGLLTPFFNPRTQRWDEHFQFDEACIVPLSAEGRVTTKILQFNADDRILEREILMQTGQWFHRR